MPLDDLAEDEQSGAFGGRRGFCGGELRELPYDKRLELRDFRSQFNGIPIDVWPLDWALRCLPHQQQLQSSDCADGLRELRMPFDEMAADHYPGTLDVGAGFCRYELLEMPYDQGLGLRFV
jgi:hypothetical protein